MVLLGSSGSGKSTFLNILGGLDRATGGHAWFYDLDLTTCDDDELTRYRRKSVGFVFQFYNLIASLTARQQWRLEARGRGQHKPTLEPHLCRSRR